ncbi:ISAs1 family transposase [Leptolyngbya sp. CCNP1308]|uniref:ISAs1 family transposase n=1 Tax=Leptolyngbya sp. CCNP1308 TaxID=3110255 RepID=UPI002B1FCD2D|nr:ISAs1 family transposase [Leptolyngbya sp. CCNP1308]MEA5453084.1 ISAs1 family transposase [Leptolyngbya sp. CCNP1308]
MSHSVPPTDSLLSHFENLEDPRTGYLIEHRLVDIVALTICAVVCGAETWVDIEAYGQSKVDWLSTFLALPHGIPSHDTISRLFAQLDPHQLQDCFLSWVQTVAQLSAGAVVAVDGKTLRRSYDRGQGKGAIHMVSAWAAENRLVLGQVKVDEKSNEITAIPELLKVLALNGCIVTLDAMGTQKTIAKQIIDQGADYILSLKGNHEGLYEDVQQIFTWARQQHFKNIPHEVYQTIDKGHGRLEIRRHWLLDSVEHLVDADQWAGLKRVGLIESERRLPGQDPTITQRYYLVSLNGGVERFAQATRSHWGIENGLHWCLDVAFHEDDSRIRSGYAPQNMAVIRHLALNLLSQESSAKVGKKAKRLKAGWDNTYLTKVLASVG